jgi:hypothetical protein
VASRRKTPSRRRPIPNGYCTPFFGKKQGFREKKQGWSNSEGSLPEVRLSAAQRTAGNAAKIQSLQAGKSA